MAIRSSLLPWRIPRTEEPGGLQSVGSRRVRQDLATEHKEVISGVAGEASWGNGGESHGFL